MALELPYRTVPQRYGMLQYLLAWRTQCGAAAENRSRKLNLSDQSVLVFGEASTKARQILCSFFHAFRDMIGFFSTSYFSISCSYPGLPRKALS